MVDEFSLGSVRLMNSLWGPFGWWILSRIRLVDEFSLGSVWLMNSLWDPFGWWMLSLLPPPPFLVPLLLSLDMFYSLVCVSTESRFLFFFASCAFIYNFFARWCMGVAMFEFGWFLALFFSFFLLAGLPRGVVSRVLTWLPPLAPPSPPPMHRSLKPEASFSPFFKAVLY